MRSTERIMNCNSTEYYDRNQQASNLPHSCQHHGQHRESKIQKGLGSVEIIPLKQNEFSPERGQSPSQSYAVHERRSDTARHAEKPSIAQQVQERHGHRRSRMPSAKIEAQLREIERQLDQVIISDGGSNRSGQSAPSNVMLGNSTVTGAVAPMAEHLSIDDPQKTMIELQRNPYWHLAYRDVLGLPPLGKDAGVLRATEQIADTNAEITRAPQLNPNTFPPLPQRRVPLPEISGLPPEEQLFWPIDAPHSSSGSANIDSADDIDADSFQGDDGDNNGDIVIEDEDIRAILAAFDARESERARLEQNKAQQTLRKNTRTCPEKDRTVQKQEGNTRRLHFSTCKGVPKRTKRVTVHPSHCIFLRHEYRFTDAVTISGATFISIGAIPLVMMSILALVSSRRQLAVAT